MTHLSALSLAINRPGAVSLEQVVASLFASGEQGAWYDPSDFSTMFQVSTGATPVTAVEQPVGLILDRRKGLVLGSELVSNVGGPFTSTTGYSAAGGATLSVSGGYLVVTNGSYGTATTTLTIPSGKYYKLVVNIGAGTGTSARIVWQYGQAGSASYDFAPNVGTITLYVLATVTNPIVGLSVLDPTAGRTMSFGSLSVKELDGNHAYQTGSTARPVLRARYNLLTYSEQFDNAAWNKAAMLAFGSGSIANGTAAPDGTTTADLLVPNTTALAEHYVDVAAVAFISGASYTLSVYAKASGYKWLRLAFSSSIAPANERAAWFDVELGQKGTVQSNVTADIVSVGSGWYRCSISRAATSTLTPAQSGFILITNADGATGFTANGTSGIYLWGADLRVGTSAGDYQRIAAATDYATVSTITGQPFRPYLWFSAADGTGDSLVTASVDFSASDEMTVCSGVAKQQNSATGSLVELSASVSSNNGTFYINAPEDATYEYSGISRGNAGISATQLARVDSSTWAGPDAHVLSYQSEISADTSVLRLNKTEVATANGDQGSGNYGNYPIYIGRRGGTTWQLNAYVYGLIIRGKNCTAGELAALESYMAGKTGVTL